MLSVYRLLPLLERVLSNDTVDHTLAELPQRRREIGVLRLRRLSAKLAL